MRLLDRYLLRQLAAPFVFGLGALTSLMLLSQIAKKFGALVGKGLPWTVIGEVFALSVPFIVAMTLPMAVLLAVLYAFSHLAADNEITAMRASGISVYQVLAPVLVWGVCMAALNFVFVDQVLPRTNARLRSLLIDIGRKKPTFELREQVINEVPPSQYFLRAGRIDAATGRLRDVTIYDVGGESSRRIIYADSGLMAYAEGQTDLSLRLYDGSIHQYRPSEPETFQLTYYHINDIRVKDVFDELERNSTEAVRGDREMSTCEMISVIRDARKERDEATAGPEQAAESDLRNLLALPPLPAIADTATGGRRPRYCRWLESVQKLVLPKTAEAQAPAQAPGPKGLPKPIPRPIQTVRRTPPPTAAGSSSPTGRRWPPRTTRSGRRPSSRPVLGRGPQEVGDQHGVHLVRHRRDRDGAAVSAWRHRFGDRRRAARVLGALRRAHRGREPGRPRVHLAVAGHVAAEHHPDDRRAARPHPGEPGVGLHPRRRLPGSARRHAPPRPALRAPRRRAPTGADRG